MAEDQASYGAPVAADPVKTIADSPLLRSVDRSNLEGLGPELEWVVLDEHEVLPLDGTQGDARYFVASGRLEIVHASSSVAAALAGSRMSGSSEPSVKRSCPSTSSAGSAWAR